MNYLQKITASCPDTEIKYLESLSKHTTFKVGGKVDFFISPKSPSAFTQTLSFLKSENIPFFIIGGGSNTVFSDTSIEGAIVSTLSLSAIHATYSKKLQESYIELHCGAGCTFEQISLYCEENELTGLESFSGLPGTLGGAVFMNARCYDKEIADVLSKAEYFDTSTLKTDSYTFNTQDWSYKHSPFQQNTNMKILSTVLLVKKGKKNEIIKENEFYLNDRKMRKQFDFPSAGSVFKNNRAFGEPSGKIIDAAGLRGTQIGGARIADWHGNFIINFNNATADDIRELSTFIINKVKEKTGFELENEILFVNFDKKYNSTYIDKFSSTIHNNSD